MSFLVLVFCFLYISLSVIAKPLTSHSRRASHQHLHDNAQSERGHGHGRDKFSVKQVQNPGFKPSTFSSGPAALLQAYLKHNIPVPPAVAKAPTMNLQGSVIANPNPSNYDREYLVPVTIGTVTPQTLSLDLDTGSSDLWVFSSQTSTAEATVHVVYKPNTCSTAGCAKLIPGENWAIVYADHSNSSGIVYNDTVTIGGVAVPFQAVEAATQVSTSFTADTASSGLIGMAFSSLNTCRPQQQLTWFDNIKTSLAAQVWTANLKKAAAGTYNFGYIDTTAHTGSIAYTPVITSRGFWEFTSSGYGFGSSAFVNTNLDAIADTGTTLLLLPAAVVTAYWAQVKDAYFENSLGAYIYPCSSTPASFRFGIGGYRGIVPGSYMDYGPVSSYWCYGGIQSQGGSPFSIFGDVLLKAQFVVFDVGNLRIGFAAKNN